MKLFLTEQQIKEQVRSISRHLRYEYRLEEPEELVIIGILNGACMFAADLSRLLTPCIVDFWKLQSYGDSRTSSGHVSANSGLSVAVGGKHVVLVDDIADTGDTLAHAAARIKRYQPLGVITVALLKRETCKTPVNVYGLEVPAGPFYVGYGMDDNQKFRNLPGIFYI